MIKELKELKDEFRWNSAIIMNEETGGFTISLGCSDYVYLTFIILAFMTLGIICG